MILPCVSNPVNLLITLPQFAYSPVSSQLAYPPPRICLFLQFACFPKRREQTIYEFILYFAGMLMAAQLRKIN